MAQIFKSGKTWGYRVSYLDEHGKRHQPSKSGFPRKAAAEAAALELEQSKAHGAKLDKANVTLLDFYDRWIAAYKEGKNSEITESRYSTFRAALEEWFGDTKLVDITRMKYQMFINDYAAGKVTPKNKIHPKPRARETVSKLNGYIRAMADDAMAEQIIFTNFTKGWVNPGYAPSTTQVKYLETADFERLLAFCTEHASLSQIYNYIIVTAILTGCRASEVIALQWPDINFDENTIRIDKSWDYVYATGFKPTKTPAGVRTIDVPPMLINLLKRLRAEQTAANMKTGYRDNLNLVFRNNRHQVPGDSALNRDLSRIETELGISSPITFHGLRHTHVSYLLSKGVDIAYISRRLGHSDVTITLRVYQHLLSDFEKAQAMHAISALNDICAK